MKVQLESLTPGAFVEDGQSEVASLERASCEIASAPFVVMIGDPSVRCRGISRQGTQADEGTFVKTAVMCIKEQGALDCESGPEILHGKHHHHHRRHRDSPYKKGSGHDDKHGKHVQHRGKYDTDEGTDWPALMDDPNARAMERP
jgi:hypothetical protein